MYKSIVVWIQLLADQPKKSYKSLLIYNSLSDFSCYLLLHDPARAVLVFILLIVTIKGSTILSKNLVMTNQIKYEKSPCQTIEKY